jgi:hypothetical protein
MDAEHVEQVLAATEAALASPGQIDLGRLGYQRAVAAVKRHPEWLPRFADRIGAIDRQLFVRRVQTRFPASVGVLALTLGALVGVVMFVVAFRAPQRWKDLLLLAGTGALLVTTHDLAHYLVGRWFGMRFSDAFVGANGKPQPGLKIDYASYLVVSPERRAWMHASGAIVTKILAFVAAVAAAAAGASAVVIGLLTVGALGAVLTDIFLSTRYSDWRRYRREMRIARELTESGQLSERNAGPRTEETEPA